MCQAKTMMQIMRLILLLMIYDCLIIIRLTIIDQLFINSFSVLFFLRPFQISWNQKASEQNSFILKLCFSARKQYVVTLNNFTVSFLSSRIQSENFLNMWLQLPTKPATFYEILLMRLNLSASALMCSNFTSFISLMMLSYISKNSLTIEGCLSSNMIFTNSLSSIISSVWLMLSSKRSLRVEYLLDSLIISTMLISLSSPRPGKRNPPSNSISFFFPLRFLWSESSSSPASGFLLQIYCAQNAINVVLCYVQYSLMFSTSLFLAYYSAVGLEGLLFITGNNYKQPSIFQNMNGYLQRYFLCVKKLLFSMEEKKKMSSRCHLTKKQKNNIDYNRAKAGKYKVMQLETYPQNSNITLQNRGVIKKVINLSNCTLEIKCSQVDVEIVGTRNKITIDESAGKVNFKGNQNQIEIRKSWVACKLEGSQNIFNLVQTEFLLTSHNGEANIIPGVLGDQHIPLRRRLMHDRIMNMRIALKQRSEHVKKLLPHLPKSLYHSAPRECSICYDEIKQGDEVTSLFCFHFFHSLCIEACLETAVKCPVCSLDLLKVINDEIKIGNFVQINGELVMKQSMEVEEQ